MKETPSLTEGEAFWLMRVLRSRPRDGRLDRFTIPDQVQHALLDKGLIHFRRQRMEITLDGIRAIGRHRPQGESG